MRLLKNQNAETLKKFEKLSLFAFVANAPNFLWTLLAAFTANTVLVWVDVLVTLGETLHSLIVWLVARKMLKETGDKYNFGMGRLEVFVSLICDMLIAIGMVGMLFGSAWSLASPEKPDTSIWIFCLMKVSNTAFDVYFVVKQIKICKSHPSKLNETEKATYITSLVNDVTMGVVGVICFLFREQIFSAYFSPIMSIILAVYFLFGYAKHIRISVAEISDASLPVKRQDEIFDAVMSQRNLIQKIVSVNCRRLNNKTHVEITLVMHDSVTYGEMQKYLAEIKEQINALEPESDVVLVIAPNEE